jgi:hypothetical protein
VDAGRRHLLRPVNRIVGKSEIPRWEDRQGKVWEVHDMGTEHIKNSMRMLLRNPQGMVTAELEAAWAFYMTCRGDIATLAMEQELFRLEELQEDRALAKEWVRRTGIFIAFHQELNTRRADYRELLARGIAPFDIGPSKWYHLG